MPTIYFAATDWSEEKDWSDIQIERAYVDDFYEECDYDDGTFGQRHVYNLLESQSSTTALLMKAAIMRAVTLGDDVDVWEFSEPIDSSKLEWNFVQHERHTDKFLIHIEVPEKESGSPLQS